MRFEPASWACPTNGRERYLLGNIHTRELYTIIWRVYRDGRRGMWFAGAFYFTSVYPARQPNRPSPTFFAKIVVQTFSELFVRIYTLINRIDVRRRTRSFPLIK